MRNLLIVSLMIAFAGMAKAQSTKPFAEKINNEEFQVWLEIDFYNNGISVPGQTIFGKLPGFLGSKRDGRKWLITDAEVSNNAAMISIINDYGSEDLTATLTYKADGSYVLEQKSVSTIKIVVNRKWVKLPKKLKFIKVDK